MGHGRMNENAHYKENLDEYKQNKNGHFYHYPKQNFEFPYLPRDSINSSN